MLEIRADPRGCNRLARAYGISISQIIQIRARKADALMSTPTIFVLDHVPGATETVRWVDIPRP